MILAQALRRDLADIAHLAKLVLSVLCRILPQVLALPRVLRLIVIFNWIVNEATALVSGPWLAFPEEASIPLEFLFGLYIVVPQILQSGHRQVQVGFEVLAMVGQFHILLLGVS